MCEGQQGKLNAVQSNALWTEFNRGGLKGGPSSTRCSRFNGLAGPRGCQPRAADVARVEGDEAMLPAAMEEGAVPAAASGVQAQDGSRK